MKFLALMGLAVIIQCASAMDDESTSDDQKVGTEEFAQMDEATRHQVTYLDPTAEREAAAAQLAAEAAARAPADATAAAAGRGDRLREAALEAERLEAAKPLVAPTGASSSESARGLEESVEAEVIILTSTDGEQVEIQREHAKMSELLKNVLEGDKSTRAIDLREYGQKITGETLRSIVKYLEAHHDAVIEDLAKPIRSKDMAQIAIFQNPEADNFSDATFIDTIGNGDLGAAAAPATADRAADLSSEGKHRIFKLILGANYMDVKSLLHLGCAKIATYIKGRGPDEIKQILGDNGHHVINGQIVAARRRRRLSKDDRSILSKMFGCAF